MVRNYKRKSERRSWSEDSLIAAMYAVENENMAVNRASVVYDVPEPTLRRYLKKNRENKTLPESGGRFKRTFTEAQEIELTNYINDFNIRAFGLTSLQCRKLVYEFAEINNISHQFNKSLKLAGRDWLISFMKRHKISLRTPESTSIGRLVGFNRVEVMRFFDLIRELKVKHNFTPDRIYNADESGLSTVPTKQPKILSPTGCKRVAKVASGERGRNTTVVCAMNAQGSYVPPFFVFARVRMRPELLHGCPPNSGGIAQQSGWMNTDAFVQYLRHFIKYTSPSNRVPVLLIVDNHSSHTSLEAINLCRESGVIMVGLPPHTTHRLQPLDVGFFGPLKTFYSQACDNFLVNNPGKSITDKDVGQLFGKAYIKAGTIGNAVKSFAKCGIEPFDPDVFSDADFAPASVSERRHVTAEEVSSDDEPLINIKNKLMNKAEMSSDSASTSSLQKLSSIVGLQNDEENKREHVVQEDLAVAGPSGLQNLKPSQQIKFVEIRPLPKINRPALKTNRKKQKASILTSTPNKEYLEEKEREKNAKTEAKKRKCEEKAQRNVFKETGKKSIRGAKKI